MTQGNYFSYLIYDWTDTYANASGKTGTFTDRQDLRKKWTKLVKEYDLSKHEYSLYVELITVVENGIRSKALEKEIKKVHEKLIAAHEAKTGKEVNTW